MDYHKIDPAKITYFPVCPIDDLPNGERLFLEIEGQPIVILRIGDSFYAIGDVCSHDDGPVGDGEIDGCEIICPRHGARFDIRNGKVLHYPAVVDIPAYPIQVVDGVIQIGVLTK